MGINRGILSLLVIGILTMSLAAATHSSSADLQPEWSPAGQLTSYAVEISNAGGSDAIDEVRVYNNAAYSNFTCDVKAGWNLVEIPNFEDGMCFYFTNNATNNIMGGSSETFDFEAVVPQLGCELEWKFETRDEQSAAGGAWNTIFDTTSVDNLPPQITKMINGSQWGMCPPAPNSNETCWITQDTVIDIWVEEPAQSACQPPSGVDYCDITVYLDGQVDAQWTEQAVNGSVHTSIQWDEDSQHTLEIECYDRAGNSVSDTEMFRVDDTPPQTSSTYNNSVHTNGTVTWIDSVTTIALNAFDPDPTGFSCNIGVNDTFYRVSLVPDVSCESQGRCDAVIVQGNFTPYTGPLTDIDESCHLLEYYSVDHLGNTETTHRECFYVDKTPPAVNKTMGAGPAAGMCPPIPGQIDSMCFVNSSTEINLNCVDAQPHPSGGEVISWRYRTSEDGVNWSTYNPDQSACSGTIIGDWCEQHTQDVTLSFPEASLHEMDWYCRDNVNKQSQVDTEYFRVDNEAPLITKTVVGPQVGDCPPAPNSNDTCYVRAHDTSIIVNVTDGTSIHASDNVQCTWRYFWNGAWYPANGTNQFGEEGTTIVFTEDSTHTLEIICSDWVGNTVEDVEIFLVDDTPPETTKMIGEPFIRDWFPKGCQGLGCGIELSEFITTQTNISLVAHDAKVGVNKTWWRNLLIANDTYGELVCGHQPLLLTADEVGSQWNNPMSYCDPALYMQWVANPNENWTMYNGSFTKDEESCHIVEYYSEDHLGNVEMLNWNCLFVDETEPALNKVVGQPQYNNGTHLFVTQNTPITLSCYDQQPHPVDHVMLHWRTRFANDCANLNQSNWSQWTWLQGNGSSYLLETNFTFNEDSCHELEYYCEDGLGNAVASQFEIDVVDTVAPVTNETILGPHHVVQGDPNCYNNYLSTNAYVQNCTFTHEYIDTATRISLDAVDPDPHPSGVNSTWYRWDLVPDSYCSMPQAYCLPCEYTNNPANCSNFTQYTTPFGIDEESCHVVEWYSVDNLGNTENTGYRCMFVDKQAPVTNKTYGQPLFTANDAEWISNVTNITLSAYDPQPHPSGVNNTWYRWERIGDQYCANQTICQDANVTAQWQEYDGTFVIPEESCHAIEFYSVDNVNKTETVNRQCAYVDTTPPTPNKTVGDPHGLWDGDGAFYQLQSQCNQPNGIDCWEVTTLTPISMQCSDPEPHPVGNSRVCFQVIYDPTPSDSGDITAQYCDNGVLNSDGYCCVDSEIDEFLFGEVSEHNLSFYCEDALGNRGPLDSEMFKVDGSAFRIDINKKWNLISVPFRTMDDTMDDIFAGKEDVVQSVWTYDAQTGDWSVYTPDGNAANDDINTMLPGWGYWLLSNADDQLVIGGSLFQAGPNTPPSKTIVGGAWNLVGYYGKDGIDEYDGPDGSGDVALCHLNSIAGSIWTQDFTGLFGYWEPDQPDPFFGIGQYDGLDPGAGYWMFSPTDGVYAKSTTCGGIGGIIPYVP